MEGQTVHARPPVSRGAIFLFTIAAALCGIAFVSKSPQWLIAAIMPANVALALWLGRSKSVLFTIDRDGLMPLGSAQYVRYDRIHAITINGCRALGEVPANNRQPLEIHHDAGVFVVPANSAPPLAALHRYLSPKVLVGEERPVNPILCDYVAEQRNKFGDNQILVIHTRELFPSAAARRRSKAVCLALLLTGVVWIVLAVAISPFAARGQNYDVWFIPGSLTIVGSWLAYFYFRSNASAQQPAVKFPRSCLVFGPAGFAMVQGDLQGVLRWEEIIKVVAKPKSFQRSTKRTINLVVQGGEIAVLDIYERALPEIEHQIRVRLGRG